jgi:hypothetical protein
MAHRETLKDPIVWVGAIAAAGAHFWVFFAGEYLPYVDWSNHLGLSALLARGGPYVERSFLPTPYLAFYAFTALLGSAIGVVAAAKVALLVSTILFTFGAAFLAESTGRDPRLGLIAPLALFGISLGYGFASFLFAMPMMLFVFAWSERAIAQPNNQRTIILLATFILLAYLGHAMLFAVTAACVFIRALTARTFKPFLVASLPTIAAALPIVLKTIASPWREEGSAGSSAAATFAWGSRLGHLPGDLLERGSVEHWITMWSALALLGLWLLLSMIRPWRTRSGIGLEVYASCLAAMYLFGPVTLEWPFAVWMVQARFATLAALLLFLLPKVNLRGKLGAALSLLPLAVVLHNAWLHHTRVTWFNGMAQLYDPVRRAIPKGARVLSLSIAPQGDLIHRHYALGSLHFYHLADGASYTAFLFDQALQPMHLTEDRPRAPFWRSPATFNPRTHGRDFDYVVLRGLTLIARGDKSPDHERVGEYNGWVVFRTKDPTPFPKRWAAPPIEREREAPEVPP